MMTAVRSGQSGRVAALLLAAVLAGCGGPGPTDCHHGISFAVDPAQATLAVGESFTPTATIESCPEGVRPMHPAWWAEDAAMVSVDETTGRTTGLATGESRVFGGSEVGVPEEVMVQIDVVVE